MSEVTDLLRGGVALLAAQIPATITIAGTDYAGTSNCLRSTVDLLDEGGGAQQVPRITFTLLRSLFTTLPVENQPLTWGTVNLRIEEVVKDPTDSFIQLRCKAVTQ